MDKLKFKFEEANQKFLECSSNISKLNDERKEILLKLKLVAKSKDIANFNNYNNEFLELSRKLSDENQNRQKFVDKMSNIRETINKQQNVEEFDENSKKNLVDPNNSKEKKNKKNPKNNSEKKKEDEITVSI